ncbi:MAG: carboxypeptidase-like regulatory domain-containing protein [Ignavibacteriales bacterium]|nr:carboxypeptidase-like regulatory domain-containing protein [Ignavibacteriales bacterium]
MPPISTQRVIFKLFSALFFIHMLASSQSFTIFGVVNDAATNEGLSAATIRMVGTSNGTIANAQGAFRLSLPSGSYRIAFSFVGYKSDTVDVVLDRDKELFVSLVPSAIQMAEVVITGEDPAIAIMRKVIENKQRWVENLKTYQFEAFTRQVLRRDTSIAQITESYSTGYWQRGDTLREVIKQKRQTGNVIGNQNFASVGSIVNFYDDEIRFFNYRFVGPTAKEAFDYYDFKLERTRQFNGTDVFDIKLLPKSRIRPLFAGTLSVIDDRFALVGVEVTPNESFNIPLISEMSISYAQQFQLVENRFWMPLDIRMKGSFKIGVAGITFPAIGIERTSTIYDYKINPDFADTIRTMQRRLVSLEASKFDSSFWQKHEVLPLTKEEKVAYQQLDSTQTLDKQFRASGPLMSLATVAETGIFQYADVRFNRAEGLFLGAQASIDSVFTRLRLSGKLGYGFSDKKTKWQGGVEFFFDGKRNFALQIDLDEGIRNFPDGNYYPPFDISIGSLVYKEDYRDYYYARGWQATLRATWSRLWATEMSFKSETQSSASQSSDYSFFYRDNRFRPQPPIEEGNLRSATIRVRWGQEPILLNLIPIDRVMMEVENSSRTLGSAFEFTQVKLQGEYHFTTMLGALFLPPTLTVKVMGGASFGTVPTQHVFTLDTKYLDFAPAGVLRGATPHEFGGENYVIATVEHNFRSTPFLALNIPYLYKNSIEILTYGTVARSWMERPQPSLLIHATDGWYVEAGAGINRILGLLRLDVTYRFMNPTGLHVTFGVATLL